MHTVRLALEAMATRFELVLYGDNPASLRAAGEEALAEINLLEALLSFYRPNSDISRVNRGASSGPVRVSARVFQLLKQAVRISQRCHGAFDITVAPLMKCWGFVRGKGYWPERTAIDQARAITGMEHVVLDEKEQSVAFLREGMAIDLGGIGKGFAIEEAALILQECGIECALLHGGTSTIVTLGAPPEADAWRIAVQGAARGNAGDSLATVALRDEALSVSAEWGKAFERDGKTYGHIIDPRTGYPVQGAELAAVVHPSATMADALSTALLVLSPQEQEQACSNFDKLRLLVAYGPQDIYAEGVDVTVSRQPVHFHV